MTGSAKQSRAASKTGLLRRGVYHRAGRDPLAPRNDGGGGADPTLNHPALDPDDLRRAISLQGSLDTVRPGQVEICDATVVQDGAKNAQNSAVRIESKKREPQPTNST